MDISLRSGLATTKNFPVYRISYVVLIELYLQFVLLVNTNKNPKLRTPIIVQYLFLLPGTDSHVPICVHQFL